MGADEQPLRSAFVGGGEQLGGFYAERSGKLFGRGDVLKRRVEQHEVFLEC